MNAVAMSGGCEEDEKTGGASNNESSIEQGVDKQQSSVSRRLSAESQEFEFNKLIGGLTPAPDRNVDQIHEGGVLASADELFYKGQLLPLQYNTRSTYINSTSSSPMISPCHEDTIEILSSKLHSLSSLKDSDVRFSSCRMDHVGLDSSLFDFTRSSSFRSHTSCYCNYYANYATACPGFCDSSSGATSAGESTSSSSRDSNGSSQDSYSSTDNHRELTHTCCHGPVLAGVNGPFGACPKRKSGFMQSWKLLFNGFRRGGSHSSSVWGGRQAHNPSFHGSLSCKDGANPHVASHGSQAACGCKIAKEKGDMNKRQTRSLSTGKTNSGWAHERAKGRRNASQNSCRDEESENCSRKERENGRGSYARGSRWQGYTRRIKPISLIKATLVGSGPALHDHVITAGISQPKQKQGDVLVHRRRITQPSAEKRLSQPSLVSLKGPPKLISFRFQGVSSSCPASVRSSPNHSGLLASPAFNNMSTMQELHSAVQGAIAHCKQSISSPSL